MKARLALALALLMAASIPAFALGLGDIELNSALNQRLDAKIHLVSVSRDELDNLQVGLASADAFKRYDINRNAAVNALQFNVVPDGHGGAYVHVTTENPVKDPFLTFLVEADWASGRLLRQYTVLLDPPTFAKNGGKAEAAAPQAAAPAKPASRMRTQAQVRTEPQTETQTSGTVVTTPTESAQPAARHAMPESTQPGTYGRIKRGETLWGIARKMSREKGVSVNQMMVALYQANSRAFMGNMNRLKEGSILRVPEQQQIERISRSQATATVKSQDAEWRGGRSGSAASATSGQATGSGASEGSRLTLVAPGEETSGGEAAAQGGGTGEVSKQDLLKLQNQLADAQSALSDSKSENSDLQSKVNDLQDEVARVRKLLSVKDDQLLALQQQVQKAGMEPAVKSEAGAQVGGQTETGQTPPAQAEGQQSETAGAEQAQTEQPATEAAQGSEAAQTEEPQAQPEGQPAAGQAESGQQATQPESQAEAQPEQQAETQPEPQPATPPRRHETSFISTALDFLLQPLVLIGLLVIVVLLGGLYYLSHRQHTKPPAGVGGSQWVIDEEDEVDQAEFPEAEAEDAAAAQAGENAAADAVAGEAGEGGHVDTLVGGKPVNLDEDDPLSEADFHMAYGLYDQAADSLKQAIQREPQRSDLQLKLLEVYFTAGNSEAFLAAASDAKPVLGSDSEDWGKAVIMGKQIAPDDPLFADVGTASGVDLDFSAADVGLESSTSGESEAAPAESAEPTEETAEAAGEFDLSMDFDTSDLGESETATAEAESAPAGESEAAAGAGDEEMLEFDIGDFGGDEGVGVGSQVGSSSSSGDQEFDKALEELSAYVDTNLGDADSRLGDEAEGLSIDGGPGAAGGDTVEASSEAVEEAPAAGGDDEEIDEVTTKLDLARAYIDMGDTDGARSILEEVLEDGSASQKQEAQSLMEKL